MFIGAQYNAKQCTAVSGVCLGEGGGGGGGLVLQRHWHVIVVMS